MRISVGKRLLLGFGGVISISIILGIVGYFGVSKISTLTTEILTTDVYISEQASTARSLVLGLRRYEKDAFLNINNEEKRAGYLKKWQKENGLLVKTLKNIHTKFELQNQTKDRDLAEKGISALSDYQKGFLKVYAEIEQGKLNTPQDANKAISKYKGFIRNLEESTIEISDKASKKTRQAEATITKYVNNVISLILGITTLLVIAGIVIGLFITESIKRPILSIKEQVLLLGEGNFLTEIKVDSQDEIGELADTLEKTRLNLRTLIAEVNSSAESLTSSIQEIDQAIDHNAQGGEQIANSVAQLAQGTSEQANSANCTLQSVNTVHTDIITAFERSNSSVKLSENTKEQAHQGKNQSQNAVLKVEKLEKSSQETSESINQLQKFISEIGLIAEFIKTLASQTNLLALNAAIEAARAGEHGKGFAVVAEEVKKLANQSAQATDKITEMIKEIQNKSQEAVTNINKSSQEVKESVAIIKNVETALNVILQASELTSGQIKETTKLIENIATSSDEIAKMMENISAITEESAASTEEISSITQEQTASLEEINVSSQGLIEIARNLKKQIASFKV